MGVERRVEASSDADALLDEVRSLLVDLGAGHRYPVGPASDLRRDLGLDSLSLAELLDRIERRFAVRLPEDVLAATTVEDWLHALRAARPAAATAALARSGPLPPATGSDEGFPVTATSLVEALAFHAERHGERTCVQVLTGPAGTTPTGRTFGALAAEAVAIARRLRSVGVGPGERVGIMLPTGVDYLQVLFGVLLAGAVPVPLYPPSRAAQLEEHLRRQARLLDRAGAVLLVADPRAAAAGRLLRGLVPSLRAVRTPADLEEVTPLDDLLPAAGGDQLALVQFTSGSTGDPKGVTLTNAQLLANIRAMGAAARVTGDDVFVSWLPLYHDMGLIGAFLAPVYFGFPLVVMSPLTFLARPATWLEAISTFRGTLSAAPNAAYQACVDRIGDDVLDRLDLSTWRLTFNGSEAVSARTIAAFAERFGRCGFRAEAMAPAYGLAELGVGLAFSPLGRRPRVEWVARGPLARLGVVHPCPSNDPDARPVVSCGRPLPGYEVRVADALERELPDWHEGAISCRGPSASQGYLGNAEATASLWRRGWLQTGDLGFVADGEVFLTGRVKDVIIRAGRNLHPDDLEPALAELAGVEARGAVVVARPDAQRGTERLVVVVETRLADASDRAGLEASVRRRCVDIAGEPPDDVVLVAPGALLRTASGKVRRTATRAALDAGTLGRRTPPVPVQLARVALASVVARGRRLAPTLWALPFGLYAWVLALAVAAVTWLVVVLVPGRRARWWTARTAGSCLRWALGVRWSLNGTPPPAGPAVVVSNHASFIDGLVLVLALPRPTVLVASTELERAPIVGAFLRRLGCAFVERGDPQQGRDSVAALVRAAGSGEQLAVFPEGAITRAPGLRPFRLGAFAVAARAGCPVVPVGIAGTRAVLRPGTYLPRRGQVRVTFGAPIVPTSSAFSAQLELRDAARGVVAQLSGEPDLSA